MTRLECDDSRIREANSAYIAQHQPIQIPRYGLKDPQLLVCPCHSFCPPYGGTSNRDQLTIFSAHGPRKTGRKSLRFLLRSEDEARDEFLDDLGIRKFRHADPVQGEPRAHIAH